jgi:hypothetical protein
MLALVGNIWGALIYVLKRVFVFLPLLFIIFIFRYVNKRLFKWETLMLFALAISIIAFHYVLLMMGGSYGWLRFFVYPLPIAMAWLPYEFSKLRIERPGFGNVAASFCCIALAISSILTGIVMNDSDIAKEEHTVYLEGNTDIEIQKDMAEYINNNCLDSVLLMDSYQTWYIILNLDSTDNVITTCSYIFVEAVDNPREHSVQYIITISPEGIGVADAINIHYPDLYENGASWCNLVVEMGNYRLYEVVY